MKMVFKQRMFSWFDSYDIFDEAGDVLYTVKGQLSWGHCLKIFDKFGGYIGMVKQKIFTWMPTFEMYLQDTYVGSIAREFTFFRPRYRIDCYGWQVEGNWLEWDYTIAQANGTPVATVTKELWNWTDTYVIDVVRPEDSVGALMLVLAIDAEKCSRDK